MISWYVEVNASVYYIASYIIIDKQKKFDLKCYQHYKKKWFIN